MDKRLTADRNTDFAASKNASSNSLDSDSKSSSINSKNAGDTMVIYKIGSKGRGGKTLVGVHLIKSKIY